MKKAWRSGLLFFTVVSLLLTLTAAVQPPTESGGSANGGTYYHAAAPNEPGIARLLMQQGKISSRSTPEQVEAAVRAYARQKVAVQPKSATTAKKALLQSGVSGTAVANLTYNRKYGAEKGTSGISAATDKPAKVTDKAKLLVLLVEFSNDSYGSGPLHNRIPMPGPQDNSTFWVKDFSQNHFQSMLFTGGGYDAIDQNGKTLHLDSMTDYYLTQSNGRYLIDGVAYQWVKVPYSEAYYGDDSPAGGHDNLAPGTARDLVVDAVKAADAAGLDFSQFDLENPYGLTGSSFSQPDGIIDHLVLVHAGVDQSGGGGLEGDDAIWAHSSSIPLSGTGSVAVDGKAVYNYIIQGENCGVGTFVHEYGHDLGLPDEYDTMYSSPAGEPVEFWSLMSSGSWLGQPLDIKPSSISIWGRAALGWVTPKAMGLGSGTVLLDQSVNYGRNEQALRVNLPAQVLKYPAQPQSGTGMWYSGAADEYVSSLTSPLMSLPAGAPQLTYNTWFDIEAGWDFASIQVSSDGGATWKSLPAKSGRMTTAYDPDAMGTIVDDLPGYTGSSNGWITDGIDLTAYAGQTIRLRFLYQTDWATALTGIFFDDLAITNGTATVWQDACESVGSWLASGFAISNGTYQANHYYIAEWRQFRKTDETLNNIYSFVDVSKGTVDYYAYNPGLLLWYRNMAYSDNWVGAHPGYGFLGVVDANPQPLLNVNKTAVRTRIAIYDATFSRQPIVAQEIDILHRILKLGAKPAVPAFDDSQAYWSPKAPYAGLKLYNYGLKISVVDNAKDLSVAKVQVSYTPVP